MSDLFHHAAFRLLDTLARRMHPAPFPSEVYIRLVHPPLPGQWLAWDPAVFAHKANEVYDELVARESFQRQLRVAWEGARA